MKIVIHPQQNFSWTTHHHTSLDEAEKSSPSHSYNLQLVHQSNSSNNERGRSPVTSICYLYDHIFTHYFIFCNNLLDERAGPRKKKKKSASYSHILILSLLRVWLPHHLPRNWGLFPDHLLLCHQCLSNMRTDSIRITDYAIASGACSAVVGCC